MRFLRSLAVTFVPSCDGTATFANQAKSFVEVHKELFNKNFSSGPTERVSATVYELYETVTFKQMFDELSRNTAQLCWTQAQITEFLTAHPRLLRGEGYATFFLFRVGKQFFVASVTQHPRGLRVWMFNFNDPQEWSAQDKRRVVVPKL